MKETPKRIFLSLDGSLEGRLKRTGREMAAQAKHDIIAFREIVAAGEIEAFSLLTKEEIKSVKDIITEGMGEGRFACTAYFHSREMILMEIDRRSGNSEVINSGLKQIREKIAGLSIAGAASLIEASIKPAENERNPRGRKRKEA